MGQLQCKVITSMEKIIHGKEPVGAGVPKLFAGCKGETISFQVAYDWNNYRNWAKVQVESPIMEKIRVREVRSVPCEYVCHPERDEDYLVTEPGLYPDLLRDIPEQGINLVRGHWKSIWVDVEIEEAMEAGIYPIKIKFTKGEEILGDITVQCEVIDAVLPKLHIPHTEWFHSDCLADYYDVEVFSEEHWRIIENFVRLAVKRNCNMLLTPIFTPPLDTAVGGERRTVQLVDVKVKDEVYTFGYEKFERWVDMCIRCGVEYFEMSHLFSQWGATMTPKVMSEKDGEYVQLFGWETSATSPEYRNFMHQFLTSFKEELDKLGIKDQTYFHISDEPSINQLETYKAAKQVVEKDLEGYRIMDANSDYRFCEEGIIKIPVCGIDHMEPFLEHQVENLWTYYCTAQKLDVTNRFIAQPGYRTRILGAMLYKYDIKGFLQWGFNFYNSMESVYPIDPYQTTDADGSFPSGDAFLVYPGKNGIPEESIRMMLMDEAMNDLRAMKLLESLAGREAVMECLEFGDYEPVELHTYPRSESYLTAMRDKIHQAIKSANV